MDGVEREEAMCRKKVRFAQGPVVLESWKWHFKGMRCDKRPK